MMKHVGKHNNQKVVVLYRQVPQQDLMCLVLYSEILPRTIHDSVMSTLESPVGQASNEFADVLFRTTMADGRNTLEVCHKEGFIKKLPTSQVIMTPTSKSTIRLDELNKMLNEMATGDAAMNRLSELDKNRGLVERKKQPELKTTSSSISGEEAVAQVAALNAPAVSTGVLSDSDIAKQQMSQAMRMEREAAILISEAGRLKAEAQTLDPTLNATQEPAAA